MKYTNYALDNVIRGCLSEDRISYDRLGELCQENDISLSGYESIDPERDGIDKDKAVMFKFLCQAADYKSHRIKGDLMRIAYFGNTIEPILKRIRGYVSRQKPVAADITDEEKSRIGSLEVALMYANPKRTNRNVVDYEMRSRGYTPAMVGAMHSYLGRSYDNSAEEYRNRATDGRVSLSEKTENILRLNDLYQEKRTGARTLPDTMEDIYRMRTERKERVVADPMHRKTEPSGSYAPTVSYASRGYIPMTKPKKPSMFRRVMKKVGDFLLQPVF